MKDRLSLRCWIQNYLAGLYDSNDVSTQIKAGWYDWFCKDSTLAAKLKRMAPKVLLISKSPKVDIDTMYVFFKNNCPMTGGLYDDFRICSLETGDVIWTISPKLGYSAPALKGKSSVWGSENNFKEELVLGTWDDVLNYFFETGL